MKNIFSRRGFVRSSVIAGAACLAPLRGAHSLLPVAPSNGAASPVRLGLASYTFRNFTRSQMIGFMKQLNVCALNAKDVKDHLPIDPPEEAKALADYAAAGITLHAAGAIYFEKDEDDDIRINSNTANGRHCRHRRRGPVSGNSAAHREICEGVRHSHRNPQSWP